ncbi:MAG: hypothetical protein RIQ89_1163, partial [Bacteroidota bacterium]
MKPILLTVLISCLSFSLVAQPTKSDSAGVILKSKTLPKPSNFNTWSVGLHTGMTYSNTDIASSDFNGDFVKRN